MPSKVILYSLIFAYIFVQHERYSCLWITREGRFVPKEGMMTRRGWSRGRFWWASIYLSGILCVVYACPRPCPWSILIPSTKTTFFRRGATTTLADYIGVPDGVPLLFRHHVAYGHVGCFAWRAGAEPISGRQANTPDGENTPSRLRVNDLRGK